MENVEGGGLLMKEASGEANMTIVTVVLIGIVIAAGTVLVRGLLTKTQQNVDCQAQGLCAGANGTCEQCKTDTTTN